MNNSQQKNQNSITVKVNYNNNLYELETTTTISASELRKNIFSKFNINDSYILTYKNKKIIKNDSIPLLILFKDDNNPLLFINDNNTILPIINQKSSITINTNISQSSKESTGKPHYFDFFRTNQIGMAASSATTAAARNMAYGGTKFSPFMPMASRPMMREMIGPMIMGISTMKHMRTPWKRPSVPSGR